MEDRQARRRVPWDTKRDAEFDRDLAPTAEDIDFMQSRDYWGLVGKLQYLVNTRPDIAYSVSKLGRFASKPRKVHWIAAQQLLQYLNNTVANGITYTASGNKLHLPQIDCCSDADFARDVETRKSTTGVSITLCGGSVVAISRRQSVVADSTTAAEAIALHTLTKEAMWIRNMLLWCNYKIDGALTLHCDNDSTVKNTQEGAERHKTKHLDIKYMFIRDVVRQGVCAVKWRRTEEMTADILTKGLVPVIFNGHCKRLGVGPLKGSVGGSGSVECQQPNVLSSERVGSGA